MYPLSANNFTSFIEAGDESIDYAHLSDDVITPEIKEDATKTKGYFGSVLKPSCKPILLSTQFHKPI